MKVVIDTNVLISGLFWKGFPRQVIDLATNQQIQSITSIEILNELQAVLIEDFLIPPARIKDIMRDILSYSQLVKFKSIEVKIRDLDDIKILACAASAKADYIVTGDKDLLTLGHFDHIKIITPADFIKGKFY